MGLVGAGFVGPHHVDAVRRLGLVDVVAVRHTETQNLMGFLGVLTVSVC
jgi:hypothetical protein